MLLYFFPIFKLYIINNAKDGAEEVRSSKKRLLKILGSFSIKKPKI